MKKGEVALLYAAPNEIVAGLAKGLLEEAGIPCLAVLQGAGQIYGGGMLGVDPYVSREDLSRAEGVIACCRDENFFRPDPEGELEEGEELNEIDLEDEE